VGGVRKKFTTVSFLGPTNYLSPTYETPVYVYGEERPDLPQLILKDGTILNVTDYWLVDDQLHFTMIEEMARTRWNTSFPSTHWICRRRLMPTRAEGSAFCYATNHSISMCAITLKARQPA